MNETNPLEGLTPEVAERVLATAQRPLPPVQAMILRLEQERMNLERDRLEVERLGLQVAQLQQRQSAAPTAASSAPPAAASSAPPAASTEKRPEPVAPRPSSRTARQTSHGKIPARKAAIPWGLLAAAAGVSCALTVMLGLTLRPKPKATPETASKTIAPSKPVQRSNQELARLMGEARQDLDMLVLTDGPKLKRELTRLRKVVKLLKGSSVARTQPDAIATLEARLETVAELSEAPNPLPATSATPTPSPSPAPTASPRPSPTASPTGTASASPTAAPSPTATARPKLSPERLQFRAKSLLVFALRAFEAEKPKALEAVLARLTALGPALEQTAIAHGLLMFLRGRYRDAYAKLIATQERDQRVVLARVMAAYFTKHYAEARKALEGLSPTRRRIWARLVNGPFRAEYPLASAAVETITPAGTYRVITNVGLSPRFLPRLEEKLASTPPKKRPAVLAAARKSHKMLGLLASIMDKTAEAYSKLFKTGDEPQVTPTVYVFRTESQFHAFSAGLQVGSTESTLGYYLPGVRALFFYDRPSKAKRKSGLYPETLEVLLHETFHQWIHLYVEDPPYWFNEGMAEFFANGEITKKGLRYGMIPKTNATTYTHLEAIRGGLNGTVQPTPLALADMLQADGRTFMSRRTMSYAQAWSFVHFLMSSRKTRKLLNSYFHAIRGGADRSAAYRKVFGSMDAAALDKAWRTYVGKMR